MCDVVIIGGGPCGATAANDLAWAGCNVAFLDRAGRIKPCGSAIPPRLIEDFSIPDAQLVAHFSTARMVSPNGRAVYIPIENGFVSMVHRENFDEFLRQRAQTNGATRLTGTYLRIQRDRQGPQVIYRDKQGAEQTLPPSGSSALTEPVLMSPRPRFRAATRSPMSSPITRLSRPPSRRAAMTPPAVT